MSLCLDMSIGPVQGFIQDSRRTRDLWGSSYLLAFLAAHAAKGVREAGGRVTRPLVDEDPLFRWVMGHREGETPRMGSLPNHFSAEVDEADANDVARAGVASILGAWNTLCDAVWRRFVEPSASLGAGTREIWLRQTRGFWEVTWVVGPPRSAGPLPPLARRKLWRSHRLPDEPGDKCTVMPVLQELSGHIAARGGRAAQEGFWTDLRSRMGELNVRDNERLSSVALVKRMFLETGDRALGWRVSPQWPSTLDLAGTNDSSFYAVIAADGDRVGRLVHKVDGDRLGRLVHKVRGEGVGRALARFTKQVGAIIEEHDGVAVYAGGDDVLALLPVSSALRCAQAMEARYREAFAAESGDDDLARNATLSAGVAYAHAKMPLGRVIGEAHRLLGDVAKDGNGRDSLAVAVLKPGGRHSQWVTTWQRPTQTGDSTRAVDAVQRLAEHIAEDESNPGISAGLLYRLRKTLSRLLGWDRWRPGSWGPVEPAVDLEAFVRAELVQSLAHRADPSSGRADQLGRLLLDLLPRARGEGVRESNSSVEIGFDGLMVARFLATEGRGS